MMGYLDKTTCVRTCPSVGDTFSEDEEIRDEEIIAMYENPIT